MITKPLFKSAPTYRNYDDYKYGEAYTKGWNDAMRFIFPEDKTTNAHCQQTKANILTIGGLEAEDDNN